MRLFKPTWIQHDGHPIFSIDINPDDIHFATGGQGDDNTGRVVIWNLKAVLDDLNESSAPKLLCQLDHHSACVNCVRWSNSGHYLASGGDDKVIIIWKLVSRVTGNFASNPAFDKNNLEIWKSVSILRGHDGDVLDLSWSPGDAYLASCSIDNTVKIWNAQNFPQQIATLEGHTSMVKGVTWDPVGKYVATQSVDKTLRIWRTSDWATEHIVKEPFVDCGGTTHVLRLGWSPDGAYLVSAHAMNYGFPTAQIVERDGWKMDKDFVGHRKAVVCVRFNKNIQENDRVKQCYLAVGSRDRSISVWSTALKRPVVVVKDAFSHSVMDITWSHCGTIMMACSSDGSVMAAQFNWKEIGKPLSAEETDALFQRKYGNSVGVAATSNVNVIPNMEVFMARRNILQNNQSTTNPVSSEKIDRSQSQILKRPEEVENIHRGPTKQIETRTADGKRRITPKFLPLPNEDVSTYREEVTVFQQNDTDSVQKENNLRHRMVSSIEDINFSDSKGVTASANANDALPTTPVGNMSKSTTELSTPDKNVESTKPENNTQKAALVNGFHAADSHSRPGSGPEKKDNGVGEAMELEVSPIINGNGNHKAEEAMDTTTTTTTTTKPLTNGTSVETRITKETSSDKASASASASSHKQNVDVDMESKTKSSDANARPISMIQVKRKRQVEELKPTPLAPALKKKFTPQTLRNFPPRKNNKVGANEDGTPENNLPQAAITNRSPALNKQVCSKLRLPPLKIDTLCTIQVNLKPECSYSLEANNKLKRPDGYCHQLKCKHLPTSMQGLEWVVCTDAPFCAISGDMHRIIGLCEDATLHVLDLKGRYAMSPILLSSYPNKLVQNGPFLMVITTKAYIHVWNIHNKTVVIKSESLLPLLNQPGNETGDKTIEITHVYFATGGVPVTFLSNGKSFIFNKEMGSWMLYSDNRGIVSSPIMPDVSDTSSLAQFNKIGARRRKPEPAIVSHIKLQLVKATEMKQAESIQQWILVLGKTLASHGLEKELHILCEDLLGPTHSSARMGAGASWLPKLADCVDKRTMLREILANLLEDLRWQDFFCEFDELLRDLETEQQTS